MITRLLTFGTLFGLLACSGLAGAHAGNNSPDVIHACIGNVSKVVRIVGVKGTCISSPSLIAETPVHWDIQGPQGVPGTNGTNGTNGINGTNGTNGVDGVIRHPTPRVSPMLTVMSIAGTGR